MAIKVRFDLANNPLPPRLILATRNGNKIRELPIDEVAFHSTMMSGSEFSFKVFKNRCVNQEGKVDEAFWRRMTDFKLAYCPEYDTWYEIYVDINEADETVKPCTALSLGEAELSQINIYGMEINTEADIDRDDYEPTVFWDPDDKEHSLIDRLLYKAPHWRIKHVDHTLIKIQRSFSFDGKSLYDCYQEIATEVNCVFFFDAVKGEDGGIDRCISVYDLENNCLAQGCGNRGDFVGVCSKCGGTDIQYGYGEDTSVFVSKKNLADEITYTTNVDSVKNCFRLEAGDDLMTASVINCNPNGSQYIWYITDDMKDDMSQELRDKLDDYDDVYAEYQNTYEYELPEGLRTTYNEIVQKYQSFDENLCEIPETVTGFPALMTSYYNTIDLQLFLNSALMPNVEIASTDAATEAAKLDATNLNPCAVENLASCTDNTAANAVLGVAKCLVRGSFQVKVNASSYNPSTHIWTGNFTVTNYSDEEDTADSEMVTVLINDDFEKYVRQKMDKAMKQQSDEVTDISDLFDLPLADFVVELGKYSMQRLLAFREACQVALDMMIQQGLADRKSWVSEENNLYDNMYLPYRQKAGAIEDEILVRTNEIAAVVGVYDENGGLLTEGMQSAILAARDNAQLALDFEAYLGEDLWKEFASFRREDTFTNPNYISDGLDNEEIFMRAEEFLNLAKKEIYRSATLQHSISARLSSLLSIREFQPLVDRFEVGNWIRVEVDGKVYRLRLTEYTLDYARWELSTVTFSDLKEGYNSASDLESLLSAVRSMTTSYGSVSRQAKAGKRTQEEVDNWVTEGFKLTTKIVGGAENQEFIMDESGLTGRELIPETGGFKDEQVKLISSGLYITDDGWLTAKTGVGRFQFFNPSTQQVEEAYGVIADTIVGNIILGQNVGIYNNNNTMTLDEDGFTLITEVGPNAKVFRILRKEANGVLTNILSIDSYGNLLLNGYSTTADMNSAISLSVAGLRTEFGQTLESYSTTTEMNSAISQSAGEILSEVSSTYMSSNEAERTFVTKSNAIKAVAVEYAVNSSGSSAPQTGWSTETPVWTAGSYVWQRTKTTDGNNNYSYSEPVCIQGAAGIGIYSITEYYAVNGSYDTPPADADFSTTVPQMTPSAPYLWNYELTTYSNQSTSTTAKRVIGVYGDSGASGRGIVSVTEYYAVNNDETTAPADSAFRTQVYTPTAALPYLWAYEQVVYTDTTTSRTEKRIIGMYGEQGEDGIGITAVNNYYLATPLSSGVTRSTLGWTTTVQTTTTTNKYLWNYEEIVYTAGLPGYTEPAIIGMYSADGANGLNTARIFLYQRAASTPAKPSSDVTYTFSSGVITGSVGNWSMNIPTNSDDPIYMTAASAISAEATATIAANSWSDVVMLAQNGRGVDSVTEYFARSNYSDVAPADANFSTTPPELTEYYRYLWNFERIAYSDNTSADTAKHIISMYSLDGEDGISIDGVTNYYLATPLSSGVTRDTAGWTTAVQTTDATNRYLWNYEEITYTDGDPTYTDPAMIGLYTVDGAPGFSAATVFLYQRSASDQIAKPSGNLTYTFATGALSGTLGNWSQTIPASNGNPCYLIQATAASQSATDTITPSEWSNVTLLVEDGTNGRSISTVNSYYLASNLTTGVTRNTPGWTTAVQTVSTTNKYLWNYEEITYSEGNPTYTTPVIIGVYGDTGPAGRSLSSITEYYAKSASNTTPPADNEFSTTLITADASEPYLWNRELLTYSDSTTDWTSKRIIGMYAVNGINSTRVFLYQRTDTVPAKPTNSLTYSFSDGTMTGTLGDWSINIPQGNKPIYATAASAASATMTVTIPPSAWSDVVLMAVDGRSIASITDYYAKASSQTTAPADNAFSTTVPTLDSTDRYLWSYDLITYSDSTTSRTSKRVIGIYAEDGDGITGVVQYYLATPSATGVTRSTSGWTTTVQTTTSTNKYLWNYEEIQYSSGDSTYTDPVRIGMYTEDGDNGLNAATVFLYQRAASAPAKPSGALTYTFATGALSGTLGSWSQAVPASDGNPCYLIQATAVSQDATDTIAANEWSNQILLVGDGDDGTGISSITNYYLATSASSGVTKATAGWTSTVQTMTTVNKYLWNYEVVTYTNGETDETDPIIIGVYGDTGVTGRGITSIVEYYAKGPSNTTPPADNAFTTNIQIVDATDPYLWNRELITYTDTSTAWTSKRMIGMFSEDGINVARVYLFQRATSVPAVPWNTITYSFMDGTITGNITPWSTEIPSGSDPVFVTAATVSSRGETGTVTNSAWATPVILAKNGEDGFNTATVFLYQRAENELSVLKPGTNLTYTFATGVLSGTLGNWTQVVPASNGNPCYMIQATALNPAATDTITPSEWSNVILFVEDGEEGAEGIGISSITNYYLATPLSTGVDRSTSGWTTTIQSVTAQNKYLWSYEKVSYTRDKSDTYTTPIIIGVYGDTGPAGRSLTSITEYYAKSSSNTTAPADNAFSTTMAVTDANEPYLWNREKLEYSDSTSDWTSKRVIGMYAVNGINSTRVLLYQRADTAPAKPTGNITYSFTDGSMTGQLGSWSVTIPSGTQPIYATGASAASATMSVTIPPSAWSDVVLMAVDGRSIASITDYYAKSSSQTTEPADNAFGTTVPTLDATDRYLWSYDVIAYSDSTSTRTAKRVIGMFAEDGDDGTGVSNVVQHYLATPLATGVTRSTSGWTTTVQTTSSTNKYLWNYQEIQYTSGNPGYTDPVRIGMYSEDGTDAFNSATVFLYQRAASTPAKPSGTLTYTFATGALSGTIGNWSQSIPDSDGNPCYMIQATAIAQGATDTIPSSEWSSAITLVEDGADGKSISSVTNHYLATSASSGVTRSTSGWTTTIQTMTSTNKYLWNYETITYSAGDPTNTDPVIIGVYGETGNGITSITNYYLATSLATGVTRDTSGWSTNVSTQTVGADKKYLWNYEDILYTSGSHVYTDPAIIGNYAADGTNGTNGTSPTAYSLIVSHAAVNKDTSGTYNPTSITLSAKSQTGDGAFGNYSGRFKIETTTNNSSWTSQYTSSSNEASKSYTVPADIKAIRCSLYKAGGTSTLLDQQTVPIVLDGTNGTNGTNGTDGTDGEDAYTVILTNENHTFAGDNVTSAVDISGITATAQYINVNKISGTSNPARLIAIPATGVKRFTIACSVSSTKRIGFSDATTTNSAVYDVQEFTGTLDTVAENRNNHTYLLIQYFTNDDAEQSASVYKAATTISKTVQAAIAANVDCDVIAYKGASKAVATIGTITGAPTGMTVTVTNSSTTATNSKFNVAVTSGMTTQNGTLGVPVTVDGKTFDMTFSYALAFSGMDGVNGADGADGTDGTDGVSITGITEYYAKSSNKNTAPADSAFSTAVPTLDPTDRYLWNYEVVTYSSGSPSTTAKRIIGVYGDSGSNGSNGRGVQALEEQYYLSESNVTQTGGTWSADMPEWEDGQYIWTRTKVTWLEANGATTITYTTPILAQAINGANQLASDIQDDLITNYSTTDQTNTMIQNTVSEYQKILDTKADNQIPYPYAESGSYDRSGLHITVNSDGSVTATGTATADVTLLLVDEADGVTLPAGVYTLSMGDGSEGAALFWRRKPLGSQEDYSVIGVTDRAASINYNYPDDHIGLYLYYESGYSYSFTAYPQLEYGGTAHKWQPTSRSYTSQITQTATEIDQRVSSMEDVVQSLGSSNLIPYPYTSVPRRITSVTVYYAKGDDDETAPANSEFGTIIPYLTTTYPYLWTYERCVYSDSSTENTDKRVIFTYDSEGPDIDQIVPYYLATYLPSGVNRSMTGWTTTVQTTTETNNYLWSYREIRYLSGSPTYTNPIRLGEYMLAGWEIGSTHVVSGVTFTVEADGSFTVDGTVTGNERLRFDLISYRQEYTLPPGNYNAAGNATASGLKLRILRVAPSDMTTAIFVNSEFDASLEGGSTFNWQWTDNYFVYRMYSDVGTTFNNMRFNPMLEVGSVAHNWVTPVNSTPSKIVSAESQIRQTSKSIEMKVGVGSVAAELSMECTEGGSLVNLGANRVTIDSDCFKLDGNGNVTSYGVFTSYGTISADDFPISADMPDKSVLDAGGLDLYVGTAGSGIADTRIMQYGPAFDGAITASSPSEVGGGLKTVNGAFVALTAGTEEGDGYFMRVYKTATRPLELQGDLNWYGNATSSYGLHFNGNSPSLLNYRVGATYWLNAAPNLRVGGSLNVTGSKNRVVDTDDYSVLALSAMESTYCVFSDLGSGAIDNTGVCYVTIEPDFAQTIDLDHDYQVFTTQTSEGGISWVEKQRDYFIVHGQSGTTFDWILYARQRGYTEDRLVNYDCDFSTPQEQVKREEQTINPNDNTPAEESMLFMQQYETDYDLLAERYLAEYEREIEW